MSDFEILSLVIMTAGLIVQILIYIKKEMSRPYFPKSSAHFFE